LTARCIIHRHHIARSAFGCIIYRAPHPGEGTEIKIVRDSIRPGWRTGIRRKMVGRQPPQ
jgi:hypothetical protein